jgi:tetratricopeptide (TPR) repeat protein
VATWKNLFRSAEIAWRGSAQGSRDNPLKSVHPVQHRNLQNVGRPRTRKRSDKDESRSKSPRDRIIASHTPGTRLGVYDTTAALRALALDDKSADAQVALGQVMLFSEWDWTAAERSFQRALAINPNHAEAYLHYGGLMEALGQLTRGFDLKRMGLECDSTSALAHVLMAASFWNQRRYDDVIVWVNKALDRDPRHLFARELLVGAYWKKGDFKRQIVEDLKRGEARDLSEEARAALREIVAEVLHAFDHEGLDAAHRCILKHMSSAWMTQLMSDEGGSTIIGRGNTIIGPLARSVEAGDLDKAFELLQGALDVRDPGLVHLAVAPQWDRLRADPRFNECLARMKLRPVV